MQYFACFFTVNRTVKRQDFHERNNTSNGEKYG